MVLLERHAPTPPPPPAVFPRPWHLVALRRRPHSRRTPPAPSRPAGAPSLSRPSSHGLSLGRCADGRPISLVRPDPYASRGIPRRFLDRDLCPSVSLRRSPQDQSRPRVAQGTRSGHSLRCRHRRPRLVAAWGKQQREGATGPCRRLLCP